MSLTAHCLVKNEENFISYAIRSVIDIVDTVIVFDTGSTDKTVEIIEGLQAKYPTKIIFEKKGECDKKRHTQLRQEMVDRTTTDWFMILDGDEVWTKRAMDEALKIINEKKVEVIESYFYECVGDVLHQFYKQGYKTIRFIKNRKVSWLGDYGSDTLVDKFSNVAILSSRNNVILKNKFWHTTHLARSVVQTDYSSGKIRDSKVIPTYFLLGKRIRESVPEVFGSVGCSMSFIRSFINFFIWSIRKLMKNFGK